MNLDLLSKGAETLGLKLSAEELRLFGLYLDLLLKWNAKVNLTAIKEPDEVIVKHFLDSLALLLILPIGGGPGRDEGLGEAVGLRPEGGTPDGSGEMIRATTASRRNWSTHRSGADGCAASRQDAPPLKPRLRAEGPPPFRGHRPAADSLSLNLFTACDIGSGAGFPGLALKVVLPDMALTLVEPIHKKAVFLRHVARTLALPNVSVLETRAEGLSGKISGLFDVAFSRAFKAPDELLPLASPVLKDGGRAALSLGPGAAYVPQPGWTVEREKDITLPFSDIQRKLLLLRKG